MGLKFGQTGSPMYRVVGAVPSQDTDLASLNKCIALRFTPQSTNNNQIILSKGGLTLVYNGTTKNFVLTQQRATTNYVSTFDYSSLTATLTLGTEYNVAFYYDTVSLQYQFELRLASNMGAQFGLNTLSTSDSTGGGAFTAQTGAPSWGGTSDVAASLIADTRDACLLTYNNIAGLFSSLDAFGRGAAPFQLGGVSVLSAPAAIGTAVWDRTAGTAAAMTVAGTTNVLGVTLQDGPLADMDAANQSSTFSTSLAARYHADEVIYTSAGRIVELPDLSGNLGHAFQTTAANQALRAKIDGKVYIVRDCEDSARYYSTRMATGVTSGPAFTGAMAMGHVGGVNGTCGRDTGNIVHLLWLADSPTGVNSNFIVAQLQSANDRFALNINNTNPTQTTNMYPPTNVGVQVCGWDGSGSAGNVIHRCDGLSTTGNYGAVTSITRYIYNVLYSTNGGGARQMEATRTRELCAWNANKNASLDVLESELHARHAVPIKKAVMCVLGASTDEGASAQTYCRPWPCGMQRVNAAGVRVVNFSLGGATCGGVRLCGAGGSTGLSFGDNITVNGNAGQGKFIAEDSAGGQYLVYGKAGTWATSGTIDQGSVAYTSTPINGAGTNHIQENVTLTGASATPNKLTAIIAALNQYSSTDRYLIVNVATSNDFSDFSDAADSGATKYHSAILAYNQTRAVVAYIRANITGSGKLKVYVRLHQPSITSNLAATHQAAYQDLIRSGVGVYWDGVIDLPKQSRYFIDYANGVNSYASTNVYDTGNDQVHLNDADTVIPYGGHGLIALMADDVVMPLQGSPAQRPRSRPRLARSRV